MSFVEIIFVHLLYEWRRIERVRIVIAVPATFSSHAAHTTKATRHDIVDDSLIYGWQSRDNLVVIVLFQIVLRLRFGFAHMNDWKSHLNGRSHEIFLTDFRFDLWWMCRCVCVWFLRYVLNHYSTLILHIRNWWNG